MIRFCSSLNCSKSGWRSSRKSSSRCYANSVKISRRTPTIAHLALQNIGFAPEMFIAHANATEETIRKRWPPVLVALRRSPIMVTANIWRSWPTLLIAGYPDENERCTVDAAHRCRLRDRQWLWYKAGSFHERAHCVPFRFRSVGAVGIAGASNRAWDRHLRRKKKAPTATRSRSTTVMVSARATGIYALHRSKLAQG
jgi:hypothetical protein